jgi:hypothetical protein
LLQKQVLVQEQVLFQQVLVQELQQPAQPSGENINVKNRRYTSGKGKQRMFHTLTPGPTWWASSKPEKGGKGN